MADTASLILCLGLGVCPGPLHIAEGAVASPPPGFITYCMRNPAGCDIIPDSGPLQLDAALRLAIRDANRRVNQAMPYRSDREHYGIANVWSADNLAEGGDCKHYALAKQQALQALGISRAVLRLAVVLTGDGKPHAVLTVVTTEGDLVLDNRRAEILPWNRTGYTWISRQSAQNPLLWMAVAAGES